MTQMVYDAFRKQREPYLLWYKPETVVVKCGKKIRRIYFFQRFVVKMCSNQEN